MSSAYTRGRWQVPRQSWLWKWYAAWSRRKGDNRSVVDLCHFVRVLLIFGPWRWFWQAQWLGVLRPWHFVVGPLVLAVVGWVIATYTSAVTFVVINGIQLMLIIAVLFAACYGVFRWIHDQDPVRVENTVEATINGIIEFFVYAFWPIWWNAWMIGRGAAWVWNHGLERAIERVFFKPLFRVPVGGVLVSVWIYLFVGAAIYGALVYLEPVIILSATGILLALAVIVVGGGLTIEAFVERNKRKLEEEKAAAQAAWNALSYAEQLAILIARDEARQKAAREQEKPAKPPRDWRTVKLFWGWLVAKKHRICPLIEPTDGPFEPPKTPTYV